MEHFDSACRAGSFVSSLVAALRMRMALLAQAALLALALPALLAARAPCDQLSAQYAHVGSPRALSVHGRAAALLVAWDGRAPSRAAAALLAAALRHAARYARVRVARATLCELTRSLPPLENALDQNIDQVVVVPEGAWDGACGGGGGGGGAGGAGARLRVLGAGAGPERLRLHALLPAPPTARCRNSTRWMFYTDTWNLEHCGLHITENDTLSVFDYYYPEESEEIALEVARRISETGTRLAPRPLRPGRADAAGPRARPALLLDYDMWARAPRVLPVEPPPGAPLRLRLRSVRSADEHILRTVAPRILRLFNEFKPTPDDLRHVIESKDDIDETACAWALNSSDLKMWADFAVDGKNDVYEVAIYLCQDDPDRNEYNEAVNITITHMQPPLDISYSLQQYWVNCTDEHSLMRAFTQRVQSAYWPRLAGALGAGAGLRAAAGAAAALDTALAAYDAAAPLPPAARSVAAPLAHLALAVRHLLSALGWSRLVLLSDDTEVATVLEDRLRSVATGSFRLKAISLTPIVPALNQLKQVGGRIIFLNSHAAKAMTVLCTAYDLGMTADAGYVWILREWHAVDVECAGASVPGTRLAHFTVSFWRRGPSGVGGGGGVGGVGGGGGAGGDGGEGGAVARALGRLWGPRAWPLHAEPLSNALTLLLRNFQNFLKNHPHRRTDLHGGNATGLLWQNFEEISVEGVSHTLNFNKHGLINPFVYIDQWNGRQRESIAVLRICNGTVQEHFINLEIYKWDIPSDGTTSCLTIATGDEFAPVCCDILIWSALAAALLALPALTAARRARRARLERRDQRRAAALLARSERAAAALAAHLVDRAGLQPRRELGCGRFGRVSLATLRRPGHSAVDVAVKALRDDVDVAEEREFLNEAVVLASLQHANVVRLVGVCAVGGPPLLLMEHAFFGDLERYLVARRHVAGAEVRHVAAPALTRLGRDAAAALEYLAAQRVVHRDLRAANCLVDARRRLKLGDFGMARRAGVRADGEAEYACRRRGLFPVRWMAPESLQRGVFTAASDAWALGVLLLELVTLGARPYGEWPPPRVMRYVSAGGTPPIPPDVSPDLRRMLGGCWRRAAAERPAAAALRAALDARPDLLRPAAPPEPEPAESAVASAPAPITGWTGSDEI